MLIDDLKKSSFLKRTDVKTPLLVTIDHCEDVNVAGEGDKADIKRVIYFKELEKPLVGNDTNREAIALVAGSRDDDHWEGHKVVLFDDPNVRFGTKITGGIRVRAPKVKMQLVSPLAPIAAAAKQHAAHAHREDPKPMSQVLTETANAASESGEEDDNPY